MKIGANLGGRRVWCIRFADDMALLAENMEKLQGIVDALDRKCTQFGMKVNVGKTKVMLLGNENRNKGDIMISGEPLEKVDSFKYLGSWITSDYRCDKELTRTRIGIAKSAWAGKK